MAKNDVNRKIFFPWVLSKDRPASFPGWGVIFLSRSELFIRFIHLSYNTYLSQLQHISDLSPSKFSSNCPTGFTVTIVWPILAESCCRIFEINTFHFFKPGKTSENWKIVGLQKLIWHRIGYCTLYCRGWRRISCATYCRYLAVFVPKLAALFGLFRTYQLSSDAQNRRHLLNI